MQAGDVLVTQNSEDSWSTIKILEVEQWSDQSEVFHCMCYAASNRMPTEEDYKRLDIKIAHAPIAGAAFESWQHLCHSEVSEEELDGFHTYLKMTDFPRYAELTGQTVEDIVKKAQQHFALGFGLQDQNNHREAIESYQAASDLFPLYFEAIDNRGYCHMQLGEIETALSAFEASLDANPEGKHAHYAKGECLVKLERFEEATELFKEGLERFPDSKDAYQQQLDEVNKRITISR